MQWNSGNNAGFSDAVPWIAVNPNYSSVNVENEMKDEESVLAFYRRLIALRNSDEVARYGGFEMLRKQDSQIFAYRRILIAHCI